MYQNHPQSHPYHMMYPQPQPVYQQPMMPHPMMQYGYKPHPNELNPPKKTEQKKKVKKNKIDE